MPIDIRDLPRRVQYAISGVGPYDFAFEVLEETDVAVYKDEDLLTLTTDYTVTVNADGTGSVTLVADTGEVLTVVGARPYQRLTTYATGGDLFAATLNRDLDSQQIQILQLVEVANRSFRMSPTSTFSGESVFPDPIEGYYLRGTASGFEMVSAVNDPGSVLLGGVGASSQSVTAVLNERVSVSRFGGGETKTAAQNAVAYQRARTYLRDNFNGGLIEFPPGEFDIEGENTIDENIAVVGGALASGYNSSYIVGGTVFNIMDGDYGFCQQVRQSALKNVRLRNGGSVVYGLVISGAAHVTEHVSADGFEYGIAAGGGLNANVLRDVLCLSNTKIGFTILPQNTTGIGAKCYPLISALIPNVGNTIIDVDSLKVRENKIGMALLDGLNMQFDGGVSESNTHAGIIIYKRTNADNIVFRGLHMENDGITAAASGDFDQIEALDTTTGSILHGDTSGNWSHTTDGNAAIWIGSYSEVYTSQLTGTYSNGGGPSYIKFEDCWLAPNRAGARLRSSRWVTFENCHMQSQMGSAFFLNPTSNAYRTHIKNPKSYALHATLSGMTVGGKFTTYTYDEARLTPSHTAAADGAWKDMATVTGMSPNNRYEYSVNVSGGALDAYWAHGFFFYDGTNSHIEEIQTGSSAAVRINAGVFQYQQNSGGPLDVNGKIWCRGPLEYV